MGVNIRSLVRTPELSVKLHICWFHICLTPKESKNVNLLLEKKTKKPKKPKHVSKGGRKNFVEGHKRECRDFSRMNYRENQSLATLTAFSRWALGMLLDNAGQVI